jgi:hypothetical protein
MRRLPRYTKAHVCCFKQFLCRMSYAGCESIALLGFTNHWIGVYRLMGTGANLLRPIQQRQRR